MKNLKSFAQHIREGYNRFANDDYSDLSDDNYDHNDIHPFVDEEEEHDMPFSRRGSRYSEDGEDDYDNDYDDYPDGETSYSRGRRRPYFDKDLEGADNDVEYFEPHELGEEEETEEVLDTDYDVNADMADEQDEEPIEEEDFDNEVLAHEDGNVETHIGNIHSDTNEHGLANLLDAHGIAINTGDQVDDLHHGGSYVVAELNPFKVVSVENGRVFGAEFDSNRFKVTDNGCPIDSEHYRTAALHNHAHQFDDDHELCHATLGFKPTSYEHIFHSKELHDHVMGK